MPKLSNPRYEAFALATASGARLEDVCDDTGFGGDAAQARRLASRKEIVARVAELRREQADLDEARPTAVIIALVRMARGAELLKTAAGTKEARLALREAQRLHMAQTRARHDVRLTVLDDEEYDAIFQSIAIPTPTNVSLMSAPLMNGR